MERIEEIKERTKNQRKILDLSSDRDFDDGINSAVSAIEFLLSEHYRLTTELQTAWNQLHEEVEKERKVVAERDAAIRDIKQACKTCGLRKTAKCPWTNETDFSTGKKVGVCNAWKWRGTEGTPCP